jgi:hypothetical protein
MRLVWELTPSSKEFGPVRVVKTTGPEIVNGDMLTMTYFRIVARLPVPPCGE